MQNEREWIDAIVKGDEVRLSKLLQTSSTEDPLTWKIADAQPTNHAIGCDMTLLQLAAIRTRKDGDTAKLLIDHGAKIDLHSACGLGMIGRIKEILTDRPEAMSDQVDTYFPIQLAITSGRPDVIECLADHGDNVNRDLRKVAYFGWEDDARDQDYVPWKPIHMACLWGFSSERVPVAQALASAGADLNAVSPLDGFRPIHLVAMPNRVDMIRFLVGKGAEIDSRTEDGANIDLPNESGPISGYGCTALMVAAAEGFVEATSCLIELGADTKAISDDGKTALDFAHKRHWNGQPYDKVIDILSKA